MEKFRAVGTEYEEYLRDESRRTGFADTISFPSSEDEVISHLKYCEKEGLPVTLQGARTGITGGAVPEGGHIINVSRMNTFAMRGDRVTLQPGVLLTELNNACGEYFFPPDPTEVSASLGGMAACNASGARTYRYGSTRNYVEGLRVVLPDGNVAALERGRQRADGPAFSIYSESGTVYTGTIPSYSMPEMKNAAGLFSRTGMDLIDLFIGSEGTLGVITEITCRLLPRPGTMWGIVAFFPDEETAIDFVRALRGEKVEGVTTLPGAKPAAIEFFDVNALTLLRRQKKTNPAFSEIPDMPEKYHTAIYVEYHGKNDDEVEELVFSAAEIMTECGGSEDATWIASGEKELTRLKEFRHAIPEAVNLCIDERRKTDPGLTKLGTDMAVGDEHLSKIVSLYRKGLAESGLESVIFGHIGNNHLHVNILPRNDAEYEKGKELYLSWADEVVSLGGTVSAEHGIGKLKKDFLALMYGEQGIAEIDRVIRVFNPARKLSPGNMIRL